MRDKNISWPHVGMIWTRNYIQFRKNWLATIFGLLLEPLFYLLAIGYGLGFYISNIGGVAYPDFFFPGLLGITSMSVAFVEASYGNFSKISYRHIYDRMIQTPIEPADIVMGEALWAASKGTLSALGVIVVGSMFGLVQSWLIFVAMILIFLSSVIFALLGILLVSYAKNYDTFVFPMTGLVIPISLFSGTYFPIENLPIALKAISYLSPLTHTVFGVRMILLQNFQDYRLAVGILFLVALVIILFRLCARAFTRHLIR